MPTMSHAMVRRLLDRDRAHVILDEPFTIQLDYETTEITQDIDAGMDCGTSHVGLSATSHGQELFSAEVELRTDISKCIATRKEARRTRRYRKTRYRKPRFDNRKRKEGWRAPSVEHTIEAHQRLMNCVHKILPVSKVIIEVAPFDIQKLKNPNIQGEEYQQGEQQGFWNVREFVLYRDNHVCQCCHGKTKDKVLNVHHIESRKTGGDSPDNLITLCKSCHDAIHQGKIQFNVKRKTQSYRDASQMSIMRWEIYNRAKKLWNNVHFTYGYITKSMRKEASLAKSHVNDARAISGDAQATPCSETWKIRQVRNHTRSLHVQNMTKGGKRRSTKASHTIGNSGLRRYDKVKWNGIECFISGSTNGRPILRNIDWTLATGKQASVNAKTVKKVSRKKGGFLKQCIKVHNVREDNTT